MTLQVFQYRYGFQKVENLFDLGEEFKSQSFRANHITAGAILSALQAESADIGTNVMKGGKTPLFSDTLVDTETLLIFW